MAKENLKNRCFELFNKHPRMSVKQLSDRYGISKSCLYRYKAQWRKENGDPVVKINRPVIEQNITFNSAYFLLGALLGVVATIISL